MAATREHIHSKIHSSICNFPTIQSSIRTTTPSIWRWEPLWSHNAKLEGQLELELIFCIYFVRFAIENRFKFHVCSPIDAQNYIHKSKGRNTFVSRMQLSRLAIISFGSSSPEEALSTFQLTLAFCITIEWVTGSSFIPLFLICSPVKWN